MSTLPKPSSAILEWGVASALAPGESESGDQYLVEPYEGGVLVAVVDGLGHGSEAAASAASAVKTLRSEPQAPLIWLMKRCHEALIGARGAVMSMAAFNEHYGIITWSGVGNVEAILLRAGQTRPEVLLRRGGVVGYQLPPLSASVITVAAGDTLILATDGIRTQFADAIRLGDLPQTIADRILKDYGRGDDDALVLVAEYRGGLA